MWSRAPPIPPLQTLLCGLHREGLLSTQGPGLENKVNVVPASSPRVAVGIELSALRRDLGTQWVNAAVPVGCLNPTSRMDLGRGNAGAVCGCASGRRLTPRTARLQAGLHLCQGLGLSPQQDPGDPGVHPAPHAMPEPALPCLGTGQRGTKGHSFWKLSLLLNNRTEASLA